MDRQPGESSAPPPPSSSRARGGEPSPPGPPLPEGEEGKEVDPDELFSELRARVLGRPVSFRRLAADSLLVYVVAEPGEKTGVTFSFNPTWRLRGPDRVLTGSREAQHDPDSDDPDAGFRRAADAVDALLGRIVTEVWVEPVTGDLHLTLEAGFTYVPSSPTRVSAELSHVRDNVADVVLYRSPAGYEIRSWDD